MSYVLLIIIQYLEEPIRFKATNSRGVKMQMFSSRKFVLASVLANQKIVYVEVMHLLCIVEKKIILS